MVTSDNQELAKLVESATSSRKWDLLDLKKKNAWMITTLAALGEDPEAHAAITNVKSRM